MAERCCGTSDDAPRRLTVVGVLGCRDAVRAPRPQVIGAVPQRPLPPSCRREERASRPSRCVLGARARIPRGCPRSARSSLSSDVLRVASRDLPPSSGSRFDEAPETASDVLPRRPSRQSSRTPRRASASALRGGPEQHVDITWRGVIATVLVGSSTTSRGGHLRGRRGSRRARPRARGRHSPGARGRLRGDPCRLPPEGRFECVGGGLEGGEGRRSSVARASSRDPCRLPPEGRFGVSRASSSARRGR